MSGKKLWASMQPVSRLKVKGDLCFGRQDHLAFVLSPDLAVQDNLAHQTKNLIYDRQNPTIYRVFSDSRAGRAVKASATVLAMLFLVTPIFLAMVWRRIGRPPTSSLVILIIFLLLVSMANMMLVVEVPSPPDDCAQDNFLTKVELSGERYRVLDDSRNTLIIPFLVVKNKTTGVVANAYYDIQELLGLSQLAHDAGENKKADQYLNLARAALAEQKTLADKIQAREQEEETAAKATQAAVLLSRLEQRPEPEGTTIRENPSPDRFSVYSGGRKPEPDMVSSPPVDNGLYENYPAQ